MASPTWKMDTFNRVVDTISSAGLLVFFNTATIYSYLILDPTDAAFRKSILIVALGGVLSAIWWVVLFSARVVALDGEGVTLRWVYGRRSQYSLKSITHGRSVLRTFYIFDTTDKTIVVWNHLGGAAKLAAAIKLNE